jgi:hypothetical protein
MPHEVFVPVDQVPVSMGITGKYLRDQRGVIHRDICRLPGKKVAFPATFFNVLRHMDQF